MAFRLGIKDFSIILLALALAAVLLGHGRHPREAAPPPPPPVDTKALEETLQKVAAVTLAAPALTSEQITVKSPPAASEKRQQEIVELAEKLGGQALKAANEGQRKVIARLPAAHAAEFRQQLGAPAGPTPTEDVWIEVRLQP